jgi:hypothetical protein
MENNTNNVTFDVTGHTKIWHKEAGKVYDDPRGELVVDKANEIMGGLKSYLVTSLKVNTESSAIDNPFTGISDANLNTNIIDDDTYVSGKDGILIGNAAAASSNSVVYPMNTSSVYVGSISAYTAATFTGVFTKTTAGSTTILSAGIGFNVTGGPISGTIDSFFTAAYARQSLSRTLNQNDTLTIDWTITIN